MKFILISIIIISGSCGILFPQEIFLNKDNCINNSFNIKLKTDLNASAETGNSLILGAILILTPAIIIEESKAYFGLSKELSAGKFPYGRAELDYAYIFRKERCSAFHISYNIDIPLNGNFKQPSIFMFSPGGGYYTDLTRKGYFIQASIGLWASTGFMDGLSIHPSLKIRKVFMQNSEPGIIEASLGVGFGFYSR